MLGVAAVRNEQQVYAFNHNDLDDNTVKGLHVTAQIACGGNSPAICLHHHSGFAGCVWWLPAIQQALLNSTGSVTGGHNVHELFSTVLPPLKRPDCR